MKFRCQSGFLNGVPKNPPNALTEGRSTLCCYCVNPRVTKGVVATSLTVFQNAKESHLGHKVNLFHIFTFCHFDEKKGVPPYPG